MKKEYSKVKIDEYRVSSPDYGELIIEMVHKMDKSDDIFLRQIYTIVKKHSEKGKAPK